MTEDSGEWCRDDPTPLEGTNRIMMMMMMYIVGFIDAKIQSLYHILQTFMSGSYIGNIQYQPFILQVVFQGERGIIIQFLASQNITTNSFQTLFI